MGDGGVAASLPVTPCGGGAGAASVCWWALLQHPLWSRSGHSLPLIARSRSRLSRAFTGGPGGLWKGTPPAPPPRCGAGPGCGERRGPPPAPRPHSGGESLPPSWAPGLRGGAAAGVFPGGLWLEDSAFMDDLVFEKELCRDLFALLTLLMVKAVFPYMCVRNAGACRVGWLRRWLRRGGFGLISSGNPGQVP